MRRPLAALPGISGPILGTKVMISKSFAPFVLSTLVKGGTLADSNAESGSNSRPRPRP